MNFIHFGLKMEIERLYFEWCEEEGIANKPNSFIVFLMEKGWLNEEKIIEDLKEPKTEPQIVDWGKRKSCTLELFDDNGDYIKPKDEP